MFALRTWFSRCSATLAGSAGVLAVAPVTLAQSTNYVQIAFVVVFVVISLSLHEAAHAWTAWKCGDPTAKDLGRITLNPLPSIDPFMTVLLPALLAYMGGPIFGGAKPVPVAYHRLHHPLRDMMLVAIAGPLTNAVLAVVFMVAFKSAVYFGGRDMGPLLPNVLLYTAYANVVLAAFNMLPIPPLDGSRVMAWLLPSGLREPYVQLERFGLFIVIGLIFFVPGAQGLIRSGVQQVFDSIDFLTGGTW